MKLKTIAAGITALALTGCASIGPKIARQAQYPYNEAIIQTWKEQLLLNLVRLRYRDDPYFLQVGSITTSHTLDLGLSASISFPNLEKNNAHVLNPKFAYAERPTITYSPLQGSEFVERILSPIPLPRIADLVHSGWSIERVMDICIQQLNKLENAPSAAGPTADYIPEYRDFMEVSHDLRELQKRNLIVIGSDPKYDPTALSALVQPGQKDMFLKIEKDPNYMPLINRVYNKLGLSYDYEWLQFTGNFFKNNEGQFLQIKSRTVLGALFYLSQSVQVPKAHVDAGLVTVTRYENGTPFDWQEVSGKHLQVYCSKSKPKCAAVSVCYRGHYFYIDDTDLNSKTSFMLLSKLFDFQAKPIGGSMPALTIPISS